MTNPFEELAKQAEGGGPGGHNIVGGAQIRAAGLQHEQQKVMTSALVALNEEFARLDNTVNGLDGSLKKLDENSTNVWSTLNVSIADLKRSIDQFNTDTGN